MNSTKELFTVGHSNLSIDAFIALLQQHGITAVGDVRSHPYSRFLPHFNQSALKAALLSAGIRYVFLGQELGARVADPSGSMSGLHAGSKGGMKTENLLAGNVDEHILNSFDALPLLPLNLTIPVLAYEALVVTLLFLPDAPASLRLLSKLDFRLYQYTYGKTFFHLWSQK